MKIISSKSIPRDSRFHFIARVARNENDSSILNGLKTRINFRFLDRRRESSVSKFRVGNGKFLYYLIGVPVVINANSSVECVSLLIAITVSFHSYSHAFFTRKLSRIRATLNSNNDLQFANCLSLLSWNSESSFDSISIPYFYQFFIFFFSSERFLNRLSQNKNYALKKFRYTCQKYWKELEQVFFDLRDI